MRSAILTLVWLFVAFKARTLSGNSARDCYDLRVKFENQVFTTDVTIDCNEFVDCEFRDCVVLFQGGSFSLVNTKLINVRFAVGGPAQATLQFLRFVRANGSNLLDQLLDAGPQPQAVPLPATTGRTN